MKIDIHRIKKIIEEIIEEKEIMKDDRFAFQKDFQIEELRLIPKYNYDREREYIHIFASSRDDYKPLRNGEYKIEGSITPEYKLGFDFETRKEGQLENYFCLIKLKEEGYELIVD